MTTKLGKLKQTAMAICCVASMGAVSAAYADGFAVSVGSGPAYYNTYAYPPPRCFYDAYGYYRCRPVYPRYGYTYYGGPYYSYPSAYYSYPSISLGYYGRGHDRDDWRWRDRDNRRWRDRDHDGDRDWRH